MTRKAATSAARILAAPRRMSANTLLRSLLCICMRRRKYASKVPPHHNTDFKIIRTLGQGAFGKVFLVQRKLTKDLYAMKVIELTSSSDQQVLHDLIS